MNILVILQLAHDFQDAPLGLGRDGVSAVEYARDRRLGNSGSRGHFAHGVAHGKRPLPDSGTCAARRNTPERRCCESVAEWACIRAIDEDENDENGF
jgi:hypothetical protein